MRVKIKEIVREIYFREYFKVLEGLNVVKGSEGNEKILIDKFFKIQDRENGLIYTVTDVDLAEPSNPIISSYRYDDDGSIIKMRIEKDEFKKYERA
jgi:hypothetical protein